jgi:uncharacterized protein YecE (DUF72 family)
MCQAESEKPETPEAQTADFAYLRLRGANYSEAERKQIARKSADLLTHGDVFVFFKHENTPEGALYAKSLLRSGKSSSSVARAS